MSKRNDLSRRLVRFGTSLLPGSVRGPLIRRSVRVPMSLPIGLSVAPVRSAQELDAALRLAHDVYVDAGYMSPAQSGKRILPNHGMLTTTVVVAKYGEEIIGTATLIMDGVIRLPVFSLYSFTELKTNGERLLEISSLALKREARIPGGAPLFALFKFIYEYAYAVAAADSLVVAVSPQTEDIYTQILGFDLLARVKSYAFVRGAPASVLRLPLADAARRFARLYQRSNAQSDVGRFLERDRFEQIQVPRSPYHLAFDSILTPDLFGRVLVDETNALKDLSTRERAALANIYASTPFRAQIDRISLPALNPRADFRFAVRCPSILANGERGLILEASANGALLRLNNNTDDLPDLISLTVHLGIERAEVTARPVWRSGRVVGVRLMRTDGAWKRMVDFAAQSFTTVPTRAA